MYEIKRNERHVPGGYFITYQRDIFSHNTLEVEAGTTGYGDSRHDCHTYFRITNGGCTNIHVKTKGDDGDEGFEVTLGGNSELETIIRALKFIVKILEEQANDTD